MKQKNKNILIILIISIVLLFYYLNKNSTEGFDNKDYCEYKIVDKLTFQELEKIKEVAKIESQAIPDKRKIKDALENGKNIEGAEIEINYNIKFK